MTNFVFSTKDYILYLLQKLGGEDVDKIRLNKIAFFVEFGYFFRRQKELSKAKYAGINLGPVINDYQKILTQMEKDKQISLRNNKIVIVKPIKNNIPAEVACVIDALIDRYRRLSKSELVSLSHLTDSYKITTNNGKKMGSLIDKKLASLETFFEETGVDEELSEEALPKINAGKLKAYGAGRKVHHS